MVRHRLLGLGLSLLLAAGATSAATITIVNVNAPGVGFNDPTPAIPVGGNPGTTVGEQRLNAFQFAADVWGATLPSDVEILVQSSFVPLACSATAGTLGAAGAIQVFLNGPGMDLANTWHHVALANRLAGTDLAPGAPGTSADDIVAFFNSNLGTPGCLTTTGWYYGFDTNHGGLINLVTVLLHEFGHGLGFANFVNEAAGTNLAGITDVFATYTIDNTTGKTWDQMTDLERRASAINSRRVAWNGVNVSAAVPAFLAPGVPLARVNAPATVAGTLDLGAAAFGAPLTGAGVSGDVVLALDTADAAGPSTTDGCSTILNSLAGKIALVDRGTCGFAVKVKNAQNAGAVGVLVAENVVTSPPAGLGGADPTITIPSGRITLAAGNALKAALTTDTVNVTLLLDLTRLAGADANGRALLNAPNPVVAGSSISHFDPLAFPNLLMEPSINTDLPIGLDMTVPEMADIGWFSDFDGVPDGRDLCMGSDQRPTVVIGVCDSGVPNTVFADGCRISDGIEDCLNRPNNSGPGSVNSCISHYTNDLKSQGVITGAQKGAIQSCAGHPDRPRP